MEGVKEVIWVHDSLKRLRDFPDEVQKRRYLRLACFSKEIQKWHQNAEARNRFDRSEIGRGKGDQQWPQKQLNRVNLCTRSAAGMSLPTWVFPIPKNG